MRIPSVVCYLELKKTHFVQQMFIIHYSNYLLKLNVLFAQERGSYTMPNQRQKLGKYKGVLIMSNITISVLSSLVSWFIDFFINLL